MYSRMLIIAITLLLPSLRAQSTLPAEDPRLYHLFFNFHDGLSSLIENRKVQNPQSGGKLEQEAARKLRIQPAEHAKLASISHGFTVDLAKWQNDVKFYVTQVRARKQTPDPAVLRQFDQTRAQILDSAIKQLSATLTPASWAGLHSYINDEHRLHTSLFHMK